MVRPLPLNNPLKHLPPSLGLLLLSIAYTHMESGSPSPRADAFPAGLRVLVVDDDPTWLKILEKMLKKCSYEVTTCCLARVALDMLREKRDRFDIVISDVNMPDMDGFNLLEQVGLEMDLPVIMMSVDGETSRVMRGVQHGACDYLLKPVRMKELRNIWQHVFRRRKHEARDLEFRDGNEDSQIMRKLLNEFDNSCISNGNDSRCTRKRKNLENEEHDEQEFSDTAAGKKTRVVWSVDLHKKFVDVVNQIGFDKVGPKKILDLMNVPGLTRENVASHLQKYRLYLSRLQKQNESNSSLCEPKQSESNFSDSLPKFMQQNSPKAQLTLGTSNVYPGKKNLVQMGGAHEPRENESSSIVTLQQLAQERKVILEENSEKASKLNSSSCAEFGLVKVLPHMPLPQTWCSEISITQESSCLEKECSSFGMPNISQLHLDPQPIKKTSDMGIYITGRDQLCLSQEKAMLTEFKTMNQSTSSVYSEVGSTGWDSTSNNHWLPNSKTIIIGGMDNKELSKDPENTMFPLLTSMENFQHILDKEYGCSEVFGTNIDLLDYYDPISLAELTSSFDLLRFGYDCIWDAMEYSTTDGLFIT